MGEYLRSNTSALDVADYLLSLAEVEGRGIDALSLEKLIFFAQCWSLAEGIRLYDEDTEAWARGPVVRMVWEIHQGSGPMTRGEGRGNVSNLDSGQKDLIHSVWESLKHLSSDELKLLSHAPGGAWSKARGDKRDGTPGDSPLRLDEMAAEATELSRQAQDELASVWDDLGEFQQ